MFSTHRVWWPEINMFSQLKSMKISIMRDLGWNFDIVFLVWLYLSYNVRNKWWNIGMTKDNSSLAVHPHRSKFGSEDPSKDPKRLTSADFGLSFFSIFRLKKLFLVDVSGIFCPIFQVLNFQKILALTKSGNSEKTPS